MKRIVILLLAICAASSALLLSGCWNRRELNDLGIMMGTAIDKEAGGYRVSAQVVDPAEVAVKGAASGRSPVTMYTATGPTVFEAIRKMTETSPRKIYAGHIRVLILGEALAREGIAQALDLLSRDSEPRTDFYLMVARGTTAQNVLKILTPLEKIPANKLFFSLNASNEVWAPTTTFTMDDFVNQLVTEGENPVLTGVQLVGNQRQGESNRNVQEVEPSAHLVVRGLALFRRDKLVGWLNEEESIGYNILMNHVKSTVGHVACPDGGKVVTEVLRNRTKRKARLANGRPVIDVHVTTVADVAEVECKIDLNNPAMIRQLERQFAQEAQRLMDTTVDAVQHRFRVDALGFGHAIYMAHPRVWKKWRGDWQNVLPLVQVRYHIHFHLRRTATVNNSFVGQTKE
ncbi:Ger(x)C family spore germination protein [Cohnella nanjingensis]|uniref:Ger(X)C family spore germination protein n=1 Tax=Cohnella nanjingensis TaxID=1387779 RepID=A0A7X0RZY5_9BACL|nr:Ger(x)C family spore germination protein [Cohnella nanjingensis]MBB6675390.1 Ger(x)C family spore germination protein [Cohnella nanjingensis]